MNNIGMTTRGADGGAYITLTQCKYDTSLLFNYQPHDNAQHIYIYCEETTCTSVTTFMT